MKHEIFGIETNSDNNKFEDKFDVLYDDCGAFFESKEVFHHEDETSFDYKYCVDVCDLSSACGEEKYGIELAVVPMFNSLCEKQKKSILDYSCVSEDEVTTKDIYRDGTSIMIGYTDVPNEGKPWDECEGVVKALAAIANVFETINGLRGYFFDKQVNQIGTTGWDLIEAYINGSDWVKATLDRYKE